MGLDCKLLFNREIFQTKFFRYDLAYIYHLLGLFTSRILGVVIHVCSIGSIHVDLYDKLTVNMDKISGSKVKAYWYNPRNGASEEISTFDNTGTREFIPHYEGFGSDWVLVLDDASKNFASPGSAPRRQ